MHDVPSLLPTPQPPPLALPCLPTPGCSWIPGNSSYNDSYTPTAWTEACLMTSAAELPESFLLVRSAAPAALQPACPHGMGRALRRPWLCPLASPAASPGLRSSRRRPIDPPRVTAAALHSLPARLLPFAFFVFVPSGKL